MQIITSQTYLFQADGKESLRVAAGPHPVLVPDWIKDTLLFRLAVDDGSIKEVEVKSAPVAVKVPEPSKEVTGLEKK
jgi:hypothetical protein